MMEKIAGLLELSATGTWRLVDDVEPDILTAASKEAFQCMSRSVRPEDASWWRILGEFLETCADDGRADNP